VVSHQNQTPLMLRKNKSWSYLPSKNTPQCLTTSTKHKRKGKFEEKKSKLASKKRMPQGEQTRQEEKQGSEGNVM